MGMGGYGLWEVWIMRVSTVSQCKYIRATVGYGRKRSVYLYMEVSEAGWMWTRNAYQYSRAWVPKLTPTNTY